MLFLFENHTFCEIMWKHIVEPDSTQLTMAYAHCMLYTYV